MVLSMKNLINSIVAFVLLLAFLGFRYYQDFIIPETTELSVDLEKCIDGDTADFIIDGTTTRVRFLAIDTPETVKPNTEVQPYGKEASEMTCSLLSNANEITLEVEDGTEKDKYDRLLAWVWVDSKLVQLSLIENGFAEVKYLYDDYKYVNILQAAQKEAQNKKVGIWSK